MRNHPTPKQQMYAQRHRFVQSDLSEASNENYKNKYKNPVENPVLGYDKALEQYIKHEQKCGNAYSNVLNKAFQNPSTSDDQVINTLEREHLAARQIRLAYQVQTQQSAVNTLRTDKRRIGRRSRKKQIKKLEKAIGHDQKKLAFTTERLNNPEQLIQQLAYERQVDVTRVQARRGEQLLATLQQPDQLAKISQDLEIVANEAARCEHAAPIYGNLAAAEYDAGLAYLTELDKGLDADPAQVRQHQKALEQCSRARLVYQDTMAKQGFSDSVDYESRSPQAKQDLKSRLQDIKSDSQAKGPDPEGLEIDSANLPRPGR